MKFDFGFQEKLSFETVSLATERERAVAWVG